MEFKPEILTNFYFTFQKIFDQPFFYDLTKQCSKSNKHKLIRKLLDNKNTVYWIIFTNTL